MTFNSLSYLLFLPLVYLVFSLTTDRWRWLVLLMASYGFYATFKAPQLLMVLGLVTVISYACGIRIAATPDGRKRRGLFWSGTIACVLILALMKYLLPFFISVTPDSPYANLLLSIGVSYFVFQALSYLIDIYLEIAEPEHHFGYFATYLAFFPKLLQGPLERGGDLLPQLRTPYRFNYDNMRIGMFMFVWGLFKKVVIADRLGLYVDTVYGDVHAYTGLSLIVGTYFYALQIYFDFSGYTDMALGSARLFNITLTQNFNRPYLATSIADFWRRWHISFSRWILDYIFKPLQMRWRDRAQFGTALALIVTFLISGIWHGATWGFVIWGGLHGVYLACSVLWKPVQKNLYGKLGVGKSRLLTVWQVLITFNLVSCAWIFFRARSLSDAWYVLTHLISGTDGTRRVLMSQGIINGMELLLGLLLSIIINKICYDSAGKCTITSYGTAARWSLYYGIVVIILIANAGTSANYIYFRF